jgi:hypothetical protein
VTHSFARHKSDSQQASDSCVEVPSNFVTVSDAGSAIPIRASEEVLAGIRRIAVEQFLSIPRGGLEAGGLLFGYTDADGLTILSYDELPIQHLSGPSFLLSPQDEETLILRLQKHAAPEEPAVIGWWHSHTRSDVAITEDDLRIHRKFFTGARQIALIVKPFKLDPAIAAIYLPNEPGVDPEPPYARFAIGAPPAPRAAAEEAKIRDMVPLSPVVVSPPVRAKRSKRGAYRLASAIAAAAVCLIAVLYAALPRPLPAVIEPMRLEISGSGPEVTVRWDRNSRALTDIATAELVIVDGSDAMKIPLTAENLLAGTVAYMRRTGKVDVTLRTRTRTNEISEAVAHYLGPPLEPPVVAESKPTASAEVERMRAEMERLNSELERIRSIPPKAPESNAKSRTPELRPVTTVAPVTVQRTSQPAIAVPALPVPSLSLGTQTFAAASPIQTPQIQTPQIQTPQTQAPSLPPPKPTPSPAAAASRPTSGRAIWTGSLPRGGVLLFDGHRPSAGAVTGRMPQRPSRFRVYSADLMDSGVVVYTNGSNERSEAPSAANGWNLTTYRPDTKRSRDIAVVESPGPANGWQRLMLRSEQRTISMLVLEWDELSGQ